MTELIAKPPCAGLLPLKIGDTTLTEDLPAAMTSLAPLRGRARDLSEALNSAHGMRLPGPGRATGKAGARAIWFSQGQVMLMGPHPHPSLVACATLCNQSDAWAVVRLEGRGAIDVLARLVPLDLRRSHFKRGHTARTECAHMLASLTRTGENAFQIMVFRSMAKTLVHELKTAMEAVASRG